MEPVRRWGWRWRRGLASTETTRDICTLLTLGDFTWSVFRAKQFCRQKMDSAAFSKPALGHGWEVFQGQRMPVARAETKSHAGGRSTPYPVAGDENWSRVGVSVTFRFGLCLVIIPDADKWADGGVGVGVRFDEMLGIWQYAHTPLKASFASWRDNKMFGNRVEVKQLSYCRRLSGLDAAIGMV